MDKGADVKNNKIVMLLSNAFRPDPRVLKEAVGLQLLGYRVTILCWDRLVEFPREEIHNSGVRIVRIQNVPSSYGIGIKQLLRIPRFWLAVWPVISKLKPSILHCHDFDTLPIGLVWGKFHNKPVVYDAHEYYADLCKPRLNGLVGKFIYYGIYFSELICSKFASAIVTVDEFLADIYQKHNPRVLILGHYPSKNSFNRIAPVFTEKELHLLYIGRISQDRGMLSYASILRCLIISGIDARLVLAGTFTPIKEMEILKSQMHDLKDHVEIVGWIPYEAIPELIARCDIGLAILQPEPRYINAVPVKMFEYMAAGLPVIASNFPEISKIIAGNNCGLLVDPQETPDSIANKIIEWCRNPSQAIRLGMNGREAINENYNWEYLMDKLQALYTDLLN